MNINGIPQDKFFRLRPRPPDGAGLTLLDRLTLGQVAWHNQNGKPIWSRQVARYLGIARQRTDEATARLAGLGYLGSLRPRTAGGGRTRFKLLFAFGAKGGEDVDNEIVITIPKEIVGLSLTLYEKIIFSEIWWENYQFHNASISFRGMARKLGIERNTVRRVVVRLVAAGLLRCETRGRFTSYYVQMPVDK